MAGQWCLCRSHVVFRNEVLRFMPLAATEADGDGHTEEVAGEPSAGYDTMKEVALIGINLSSMGWGEAPAGRASPAVWTWPTRPLCRTTSRRISASALCALGTL